MRKILIVIIFLTWSILAFGKTVSHTGPSLEIFVERDNVKLPFSRVDKLKIGDKLYVAPLSSSLSKEKWLLVISQISPSGSDVKFSTFNLDTIDSAPFVVIKSNNEIISIVLAPQLRTFFGLTNSFGTSASTIEEIISSDPQRFIELQKLDLINKVIRIITQSIENLNLSAGRGDLQVVDAIKQIAFKYGVRNLNSECFKNNTINVDCVALNIVSSNEFSDKESNDLESTEGAKKTFENLGFLGVNIRLITDAGNFLTDKFRDRYVFSPAYSAVASDNGTIQLFSLARFKSGNVKTAYAFTPSWFDGMPPNLSPQNTLACLSQNRVEITFRGKLPLGDYWHSWGADLFDVEKNELVASASKIKFKQEDAAFTFQMPETTPMYENSSESYELRIHGKYGFQDIFLETIPVQLPRQFFSKNDFINTSDLISGESGTIRLKDNARSACLTSLELESGGRILASSTTGMPYAASFDLSNIEAGKATIVIAQHGTMKYSVDVPILPAKAKITSVDHVELEPFITVKGSGLSRIDSVAWGNSICRSDDAVALNAASDTASYSCSGDVRHHKNLPNSVVISHKNSEPNSVNVPIKKISARPQVVIAVNAKNAVLVQPSAKAIQWNLLPTGKLMSEDSGLHLMLTAVNGYSLTKSTFVLQLRAKDDPDGEKKYVSVPLISDPSKSELRTRNPLYFKDYSFPGVINPLEFRVVHQQTGLASQWAELGRAVVTIPEIKSISCVASNKTYHVHGAQLEITEDVYSEEFGESKNSEYFKILDENNPIENCNDGLCLKLTRFPGQEYFYVKLRWAEDIIFKVKIPTDFSSCQ